MNAEALIEASWVKFNYWILAQRANGFIVLRQQEAALNLPTAATTTRATRATTTTTATSTTATVFLTKWQPLRFN